MNEKLKCYPYFLRNLFNNYLLIFLLQVKSRICFRVFFLYINKFMKCNIWISNTLYKFDYNLFSFHHNQLYFGIKLKRTFQTKICKLQVPSSFVSRAVFANGSPLGDPVS